MNYLHCTGFLSDFKTGFTENKYEIVKDILGQVKDYMYILCNTGYNESIKERLDWREQVWRFG